MGQKPGHCAQQGGFSVAVRPQYSHQLAGGIYRKMNILQDVLIAKTDGQILHSEHYRVSLPGFIIR